MNILECIHLSKRFGNKLALDDVNLTIQSGKIVGLLGKNGVGKSTLLKLINDLLTPTDGEILVDGKPIGVETKRVISFLPERTALDKGMTVEKVIAFFADFYADFNTEKAERLLSVLGLDKKQKLGKMSKGMQEKVQLVIAMSREAKLYILDEPLGGVDPATRDYILDTILTNFSEGASVIISTHLVSDIERILDEIVLLDNGQVVLVGDADEIRQAEGCSIDELFRRMFKC